MSKVYVNDRIKYQCVNLVEEGYVYLMYPQQNEISVVFDSAPDDIIRVNIDHCKHLDNSNLSF